MNKFLLLMFAGLLVAACEKPVLGDVEDDAPEMGGGRNLRKIRFEVSNGGWQVVTRALEADGQEMPDLWLFDYMDGVLVQTVHKAQGDADFAEPVLTMKQGRHHVYFVASRGKSPVVDMDAGTVTWSTPSDTFWEDVEVDVAAGGADVVAVVLDRVATRLRVVVTDELPQDVAYLRIKPSVWWYGLDYTTGAAVGQSDHVRQVTVTDNYKGTAGVMKASFFGLSDSGEWTTDIIISAVDADGGVLGEVTLEDVPFMANRQTVVSGRLFSVGHGFSVDLNAKWGDDWNIGW